jgi:hypothetical protein
MFPQRRGFHDGQLLAGGPFTFGTGGGPPPGYAWVTRNGEQVTFTGTINGVSYVSAPVYARAS